MLLGGGMTKQKETTVHRDQDVERRDTGRRVQGLEEVGAMF